MQNCVVLNGDYTYLNTVNWQKAIKLIVKGKATVLKYTDMVVKTAEQVVIKIPAVMKLIKIIRTIYRTRVPFSKKNVMIRDDFKCQYCGKGKELTIDHVIPVSRGGKSVFENCVSACKECNNRKGSQLPSEANMYLRKKPIAPTISEFTRVKAIRTGVYNILKDLGIY
jgi:5-methylcytosine-specific restriction endonuclease McrA